MKRLLSAIMVLFVLLFSGCAATRDDVTTEEIIAAYQDAGFSVSSGMYDEPLERGQVGYIQADHPDGDYIYFAIYESEEAAKAAKEELYHPGMMGLFSFLYGDPSWQRWEVHGNIIVEYDDPEFYDTFEELLKSK